MVATTAVLVLAAAGVPDRAGATGPVRAAVSRSESLTSGTWAAVAGTTSMTFTTNTDQVSTVTNTGTVALSAIDYKVTVSNPAGSPSFTLFACTAAWVSNKCAGGTGTKVGTSFAKSTTTTATSTVVPPLGGAVYLQFVPVTVTASTTVTLGTSVTAPTQLRSAVKTNQ